MTPPLPRWPAALLLVSAPVFGADPPVSPKVAPEVRLEEVVVTGKRFTDTEERRYSTAAKSVFGREELDRHGDSSVTEVLKRLPGVTLSGTPGRGGDIRMRGLGKGYTQILINGEAMARGFSLDSLSPEQVERIEIMRAPVAEHSARAVAGTINIVLREEFVKKLNEVQPTLGWEEGRPQPGLSVRRSDSAGNFGYNLMGSVYQRDLPNVSTTTTSAFDTRSGAPTLRQIQHDESRATTDGVRMNGNFNWKLGGGDSFTFQPFLGHWSSRSNGASHLEQTLGATPAQFANAATQGDADGTWLRGMSNLKLKLADGARLEVRLSGGGYETGSRSTRRESDAAGNLIHTRRDDSDTRDSGFSTGGKYSSPLGKDHQFAAGWDIEMRNRRETASSLQDGVNPLARYGDAIRARTQRLALFAQDEWDIDPLWAVYGGLRWEGIRTASESAVDNVRNQSSVVSPLFHSVWRFDAESKDQVRLALTRSYRAPTLSNLTAVPTLAANYPVSGSNTATSADSIGNPNLRPELAWGLDLAYEHYLANGGLLSISLFHRNIDDLIRNVTSQQTVNWSSQPRWVSTPQNIGSATSRGVELEAKFRLDELIKDAPPLSLRANASRYWSRVEDIPGPDNRLDQQPTWSANLGADYRLRGMPLTLGGNLNWTPAFDIRQTEAQFYSQGVKKVFDVYALWKFDPNTQLRLSAANVLSADYTTANREVFANTDQTAQTVKKTFTAFSARLEIRF